MDTRLALLSGATFVGVLLGGILLADPGVADSVDPARVAGGLFGAGDSEDQDAYSGDVAGVSQATFESEREDDDDRFEREDDDRRDASYSSSARVEHEDEEEDD